MSKKDKDKVKNPSTLRRLMKYLKPHAWLLVAAFFCAVISAGGQILAPVVIGNAVNYAVGAGDVDTAGLIKCIIALAVIIGCVLVFQWLMNLCAQRASHLAVRNARRDGFAATINAPLSFVDAHSHGDLSARISVDADQIADGIVQGQRRFFRA